MSLIYLALLLKLRPRRLRLSEVVCGVCLGREVGRAGNCRGLATGRQQYTRRLVIPRGPWVVFGFEACQVKNTMAWLAGVLSGLCREGGVQKRC